MAKHYENYNASYPLAYYEIGTIYGFYGSNSSNAKLATPDQIRKFSSILNELEENENANVIKPVRNNGESVRKKSKLQRYYAVVIEKKQNSIVAMFRNSDNGKNSFLIKRYIVSSSCSTDGKDLMPVQTSSSYNAKADIQKKVGGITKVENRTSQEKKIGGITRVGTKNASITGVGGITRSNKNLILGNSHTASTQLVDKVGGVTRVKKVGGITRAK